MDVRVDTARMTNAVSSLRNLITQLTNAEGTMKSNEATLSSQWEGGAHDEFHRAFTRNVGEFHEFLDTIEKYCKALEQYVTEYENMEKANKEKAKTK